MFPPYYSPVPVYGGLTVLALVIILDLILRGVALWRSSRNNQLYWFIALLVINSIGILPAIYLLFFQPKKASRR